MRCSPTLLLHTNRSRELSFTQVPNPHPVRCSPTMLLHTKGSRELSFIQVPKPHAVRCSPTLLLHTKGSMELSFTQLPSPTPWGVLLPCYYIPMGARSYHSHKSLHPHPVRCSATLLIHTNGSMELSFTQVPTPSAREVFFYHAITYQREHGAIIHPTPHTPTLWGVLLPCYYIPRGAGSYHSPKSPNPHTVRCSPTILLDTKGSRKLSFTLPPKCHPVRCSPTLLLHNYGSRELSFTQVHKPPHCEVFSNHSIRYKGKQGAIIHPGPQTPTL